MRRHDFDPELPFLASTEAVLSICLWQCYGNFLTSITPQLDDTTNGYDDDAGGYSRGPRRPPMRKDRDDKVHDSIIEERIQRERPCRTLFIRNIKASAVWKLLDKDFDSSTF